MGNAKPAFFLGSMGSTGSIPATSHARKKLNVYM